MFLELISGNVWQVYPQKILSWMRIGTVAVAQKLQDSGDGARNDSVALDATYLNRVTFGDKPLRTEIVGLFLSQVSGLVRNLNFAQDAKAWHFLTHTLKGAGAAVGAQHIVEIAKTWEGLKPPVEIDTRATLAAELKSAILAFEKAAAQLH